MTVTKYILRKTVLMRNHEHPNVIGKTVPLDDIHSWIQTILSGWSISAMHTTEWLGKTRYMDSDWQQTNLKVNGKTVVSIYVEEW